MNRNHEQVPTGINLFYGIIYHYFIWNYLPLHALRYLPNIRYSISLFIFVIRYSYAVLRYSYSVFIIRYLYSVFVIRYSYALFVIHMRYSKFFFPITLFCDVLNYESNAITRSVRKRKNRKIYSKRIKLLR